MIDLSHDVEVSPNVGKKGNKAENSFEASLVRHSKSKKVEFYKKGEGDDNSDSEEDTLMPRKNNIQFDPINQEVQERINNVMIKGRKSKQYKTASKKDSVDAIIDAATGGSFRAKKCECEATIMCVDDNPFNLMPLTLLLKSKLNIKVIEALNGAQAVEKFVENRN